MSSAIEHVSDRVPVPAAGDADGGERIYDVVHGRLRRNAIAYTAAVTAVALVGGFFVHGERAFLVAWIYTGGAVALPALLVNWMVSRREIGGMPGGTAWSFGLIWVYVDGLALLHITARPDSPLRDLTVPAVLPAITFFAVAALQLGRRQNPAIPVVRVVLVTLTVFGAVAAVAGALVGMRVGSSDAVWLAHPAALVAVVTTSGAVVSAWHQRGAPRRAHALNRLGVAVLALGAITSWSIVAQSLSGFTLPSSPLLVLQAVTMGLLLQIPLHAPRLVPEGAGRLAAVEITSRAWFAEDPDENAVLPRRLRRPALVYVAVTAPLIGLGGLLIEGRSAFLMAWVYTSAVYTTPAMVVTWAAARRTRYQATAWRLWFLGVVALYLNGAGLLLTTVGSNHAVERLAIVAVLPCVALFGAASIAMMRARSGARALSVDVVENTMVSVVACAAVLLLVGDRIWRTDEAWFTVPAAVVTVAMTSGLTWTVTIYARMSHAHRRLETLGLVLAVVGTIDAWAMLAQGLSGFTLPSAPLLFLQAVSMGLLLLLPLYVPRTAPEGLERLPPHAQVRNGWVVVALTLAVLPVLFLQALLVQDRLSWSLVAFSVVVMELLVLAMLRQLLAIGETRRLYRLVTEAADERRRLLADVMRSVDEDRHRVASQLHDQAIFSYVAFDSMTREAVNAERVPGATVLAGVSARLRDDLAEQAESLRHLMLAVRPLEAGGAPSQARRLTSPIRAYVDSLYGDAGAPRLRVDIDDDVRLDWTTETVVLRVVQEAIGNVRRHAGAGEIAVSLGVDDGALALAVVDDGVGFDPATVAVESGLTTMRSFAALAGAALTVEARPGGGTRVLLRFGEAAEDGQPHVGAAVAGPEPRPRPHLRLAPDPSGGTLPGPPGR